METFDFTILPPKWERGAAKWEEMLRKVPTVPQQIVPLSMADMEFVHPKQYVKGMQEYISEAVMCYTAPTDSYFSAVTGWMRRRHGWNVEKEWVVPFASIVPALGLSVRAYTEPGDGVAVLTPVYHPFYAVVRKSGRKLVPVSLIHEQDGYKIDFDQLEAALKRPDTKLLLFCSPHNPVGRVWHREELETIVRLCEENDVTIVSDEIHADLVMPGAKHIPTASVSPQAAQRTVTCTAPSKTFNIAGMRASNIIISDTALREKFLICKDLYGGYGMNAPAFHACELVYSECEDWLDALLPVLCHNRDLVQEFMEQNLPQIQVQPLEGTYLQWWDCRGLGLDAEELERFMNQKAYLFFSEGYTFGEQGRGFERANLACPTWVLEESLARLQSAVSDLSKGKM